MTDGDARDRIRAGPVTLLLLASVALAAVLAWQALAAAREQRATAEKVLRDYAMLAADEFARRSANEVGFNGFYPLVTALRQAPGPLLAPGDLSRSADETVRRASDLVLDTFRRDPRTGVLEVLGPEPSGPVHAWLSEHLATGPASPSGRRYETLHGDVAGALRSFVFAPSAVGTPGAVVGFEVALPALALRFQRARDRGPLFPQSVARGVVGNEALFLRVLDPFGREIFRAGVHPAAVSRGAEAVRRRLQRDPRGVRRRFGR